VDIEQEPEKDISAHVPEPEEEEERSNPSDSEDNLFTDEQIAAESERYKKKTGAKRRSNRSKRDFKTRSEVVTRERNVAAQSSNPSLALSSADRPQNMPSLVPIKYFFKRILYCVVNDIIVCFHHTRSLSQMKRIERRCLRHILKCS